MVMTFHPTCFEVYKRVSPFYLGHVDIDGLFHWRPRVSGLIFFNRFLGKENLFSKSKSRILEVTANDGSTTS